MQEHRFQIGQTVYFTSRPIGHMVANSTYEVVKLLPSDGAGPLLPGASETSEYTQRLVDEEVRRLVEAAHEEVTRLLTDHREQLDRLAEALLRSETLDAADAYAAGGVPLHPQEPTAVS